VSKYHSSLHVWKCSVNEMIPVGILHLKYQFIDFIIRFQRTAASVINILVKEDIDIHLLTVRIPM